MKNYSTILLLLASNRCDMSRPSNQIRPLVRPVPALPASIVICETFLHSLLNLVRIYIVQRYIPGTLPPVVPFLFRWISLPNIFLVS